MKKVGKKPKPEARFSAIVEVGMFPCKDCGLDKPPDQFYRTRGRNGLGNKPSPYCVPCHNKRTAKYYKKRRGDLSYERLPRTLNALPTPIRLLRSLHRSAHPQTPSRGRSEVQAMSARGAGVSPPIRYRLVGRPVRPDIPSSRERLA